MPLRRFDYARLMAMIIIFGDDMKYGAISVYMPPSFILSLARSRPSDIIDTRLVMGTWASLT